MSNELQAVLDQHLNAISERDVKKYSGTLLEDDRLNVIMPNGNLVSGFDEVVALHRSWFQDDDWVMNLSLQSEAVFQNYAVFIYDVVYKDVDESGKPYELNYVLTLHFSRDSGEWKLVFDQNTMKS